MSLGIITAGAVGSVLAGQVQRPPRSIGPIVAQITESERHVDEIEITEHPVQQGAAIADHMFKKPAEVTLKVSWSNSPTQSGNLLGGVAGALGNLAAGTLTTTLTQAASKAIGGSALGNLAVSNLEGVLGAGFAEGANQLSAINGQVNTGTGVGTTVVQDVYQQLLTLQKSASLLTIYTGKKKYVNMLIKSITVETDVRSENALNAVLVCREVIIVNTGASSVTASPLNQVSPELTNPITEVGTVPTSPAQQGPSLGSAISAIYP